MAEAYLDNPGDIKWFKRSVPLPVIGPCPHDECRHLGTGVIAWGPTLERYELVACGSLTGPPSTSDCGQSCRAWSDERGRIVTLWMHVQLPDQRR